MTDKHFEHRAAYVVYRPNHGYVKNKQAEFTKAFEHARLFKNERDAVHCIDRNPKLRNLVNDKDIFVIPVEMTLDPRELFKTVLKGGA